MWTLQPRLCVLDLTSGMDTDFHVKPSQVMRDTSDEIEEIRETLRDSQRGSRNEAIKARYHGTKDDKLAQKYLERAQNMAELTPPEDEGVCSLWVGGLTPAITKQVYKRLHLQSCVSAHALAGWAGASRMRALLDARDAGFARCLLFVR